MQALSQNQKFSKDDTSCLPLALLPRAHDVLLRPMSRPKRPRLGILGPRRVPISRNGRQDSTVCEKDVVDFEGVDPINESSNPLSESGTQDVQQNSLWRRFLRCVSSLCAGERMHAQRVNQLDAMRIDGEQLQLLEDLFFRSCRHLNSNIGNSWHLEARLLLQILMWAAYTARSAPTPGDILQNIKYACNEIGDVREMAIGRNENYSVKHPMGAPDEHVNDIGQGSIKNNILKVHSLLVQQQKDHLQIKQSLSWRQRILLLLLTAVIPYAYQRFREIVHLRRTEVLENFQQVLRRYNFAQTLRGQRQQASPVDESEECRSGDSLFEQCTSNINEKSSPSYTNYISNLPEEWLKYYENGLLPEHFRVDVYVELLYRVCMWLDAFILTARFILFFLFLRDGKYRRLSTWILGIKSWHIHQTVHRNLSFELLQHQLQWRSLAHTLLLLLPHLDIPMVQQWCSRTFFRVASKTRVNLVLLITYFQSFAIRNHIPTRLDADTIKNITAEKSLLFDVTNRMSNVLSGFVKTLGRWGAVEHPILNDIPGDKNDRSNGDSTKNSVDILRANETFEHKNQRDDSKRGEIGISSDQCTEIDSEYSEESSCCFCNALHCSVPFKSDCGHIFCYWCVAAHPSYRARPNDSLGIGIGSSKGEDDQECLRCPICDQIIGKIVWVMAGV